MFVILIYSTKLYYCDCAFSQTTVSHVFFQNLNELLNYWITEITEFLFSTILAESEA